MFTTVTQLGLILTLTMLISACITIPQPRAKLTEQLEIPALWESSRSADIVATTDTALLTLFAVPELKQLI